MKHLCLGLLFWGFVLSLGVAQNPVERPATIERAKREDMVILKTGRIIRGKIQQYDLGQKVVIQTTDGLLMDIPFEILDKFVVGAQTTQLKSLVPRDQPFLTSGHIYNNLSLFIPFGAETQGATRMGIGVEHSIGYQLKPRIGVGLGTGLNFMFGNMYDGLVPIFAEFRWYNNPERRNRYYWLVDSGHALGWSSNGQNLGYTLAGGWRMHTGLGAIWNNRGRTRLSTELGYWHQKASVTQGSFEINRWEQKNQYNMNRWLFKIGLMF